MQTIAKVLKNVQRPTAFRLLQYRNDRKATKFHPPCVKKTKPCFDIFDALYIREVLHWFPAEHRISYRITSLVWRCLLGLVPVYLRELCCPLLSAMSSQSLRSSQQGLLLVPFACTSTKQSRAFSVVVPRSGKGSLLNFGFCLEPCHLRFFSP